MAVKESSDELNPAVVVPKSAVATTKTPWQASDYLALAIATFGVGYLPLIPGTFGSLVGVGIFLLLFTATSASFAVILISILVITFAGIWAAFRTEELEGRKDPGKVVIDEVAGQMITLLLAPAGWKALLAGFILFRAFDMWKPFPLRRLEKLPEGSGVVMDDVGAGIYGFLVMQLLMYLHVL